MKRLFLLFVNFLILSNFYATHLKGGNLAYEFIGIQPNGDFRYKIKLNYYFDCGPNSNWQPPNIPTNISVAVYAHDDPTEIFPINPGNYDKYGSSDIQVVYNSTVQEYFEISPNNPANCSLGSAACIYTVLYTGEVDLAPNNPSNNQPVIGGYFLIHEACCRNGAGNGIDNIQNPGAAGMAFYAYIPPYGYENDSPVFTDDPLPFICANDTTTFLNTAIDPDGDELVYNFFAPLDGNHSGGFGGSNNVNTPGAGAGPGASLTWYPDPYPWPIEEVTYASGYSYQQPFGSTGYYNLNASNGLTKYKSSNLGKYVVGIMVKEYRNGALIGISTREVELNIISCPPNDGPNLNPNAGTTNSIFTIEEGENLSFNFGFYDPDTPSDSLVLNIDGQIFDSLLTNPSADVGGYYNTLYSNSNPTNGTDTISTTFNWDTDCGQAQALPYIFSASVSDRGCPPKTTNIIYQLYINQTAPPANIYGILAGYQNTEVVYSTDNNPNIYGYVWGVSNNGIITQDYGDSVKILWTSPGTGTVSLKALNQYGCESDQISRNTTITISTQTYVPDDNFEAYLETHDANGNVVAVGASNSMGDGIANNDSVTTANIIGVTNLDPDFQNIADLTGIEDFTALTYLSCMFNNLTNLDVSQNTALFQLVCNYNQLTSLDLSQNTALYNFTCSSNQLTSLNVSQNTALTQLNCDYNQLTSLDVRNGNNIYWNGFYTVGNPNLNCISVDDTAYFNANFSTGIDSHTSFSTDCALFSSLTADFSASDFTFCLGTSVTFTDLSTGTPTAWAWDFGDGTTSNLQNPTHTYASVGTHDVSLTVTTSSGSDSETKTGFITVTSGFLSEETLSACDSLVWSVNGNTYTQSGIYYDSLQISNGCDSIYKLDLTISPSTTDFNYGGATTFCVGGTNPIATITGDSLGIFTATGGLTVDSLTGEIDLSTATVGNYQVTYTPPSNWQQIGQDIDGEAAGDKFGTYVDLSSDGNFLATSSSENSGNGARSGHVRVFDWNGASWIQKGADIDGEAEGDVACMVAINDLGNRVVIGAPLNDGNGDMSGHARVYEWNGISWIQVGQDIDGNLEDRFGYSVDISGTGNRIIVSGILNDDNGTDAGNAKVYDWNGASWIQVGQAVYGLNPGDRLGQSVRISKDGNRVAVCTRVYNGANFGSVQVFDLNGANWIQLGQIIVPSHFVHSLEINSSCTRIIINSGSNNGASTYNWDGTSWSQIGQTIDGTSWSHPGQISNDSPQSVSINASGNRIALALNTFNSQFNLKSSLQIFDWNGIEWVHIGSALGKFTLFYPEIQGSVSLSGSGNVVAIGAVDYPVSNINGSVNVFGPPNLSCSKPLNITISETTYGTDVISSCDSITWIDGITYTASNNSATYTLTNSAGCDSVVTLNLTITQGSNLLDLGADTTLICDGSSQTLDAGTGFTSYTWSDGSTNQTLITSTVGTYSVTGTDVNGCTSSDSMVIDILTVDITQNDTTICEGDSLVISVNTTGVSQLVNDWIEIAPTANYSNIIYESGKYYLRSNTDVLESNNLDGPWSSLNFNSQIGISGGERMLGFDWNNNLFTATSHNSIYSYDGSSWISKGLSGGGCRGTFIEKLANGRLIVSKQGFLRDLYISDNSGLNWTNVTNVDNDYWDIVVADDGSVFCSGGSNTPSLTGLIKSTDNGLNWSLINSQLDPSITFVYSVEKGLQGEIYAIGNTEIYKSLDNGNTWTFLNAVPGTNASYFEVTSNGDFYIFVSNNGFYKSVNDGLTWDLITDFPLSLNGTIRNLKQVDDKIVVITTQGIYAKTINPQSNHLNWSPTNKIIPSITVQPTNTTTFIVDVTSGNTTCQDSVTVTVNPIINTSINSTVCDSIQWLGNWLTTSGSYTDSLQNTAGCDSVVTLNLTISSGTNLLDLGADTTLICDGSTQTLDAGTGFTSYLWNDGSTSQTLSANTAGTYIVTGTDANGCTSSDSMVIDILNVDITLNDTTICEGNSIGLTLDGSLSNSNCIGNLGQPNPWPFPTAFDGGYISLGNFGAANQFSISFRINPDSNQNGISIILDCSHGGSSNWVVQNYPSGGNTYNFGNLSFTLIPNIWQHVLLTYDNGFKEVFINGVSTSTANELLSYSGSQELYLGNWPEGGRRFAGLIDELYITYDIQHNTNFLPLNYNSTPSLSSFGIWHFDEGIGSSTINSFSNTISSLNDWYWSTNSLSNSYLSNSTILWSTNENTSSITVQPSTATTYTVDVTSGNTTCQDSIIVTVNPIVNTSINSTVCDSIQWSGNWLSTSGSYTDSLQNAAGCDSIVTLNLTINQGSTGTDIISSCDSYTWIDGITYTASNNTATHTLINSAGCDSIVTLDLTIGTNVNAGNISGANFIAVGSISLLTSDGDAGGVWTSSDNTVATVDSITGEVTGISQGITSIEYTVTGSGSCSSQVSNYSIAVSLENITINDGGTVYTCSGKFTDSGGLTANYADNQHFIFTLCPNGSDYVKTDFTAFDVEAGFDSLIIYDGANTSGTLIGSFDNSNPLSGIIQASSANATGCLTFEFHSNSTINLAGWEADISCESSLVQISDTICDGSSYNFNGNTLTTAGIYTDTLISSIGQDSVVTLDLTVNNTSFSTDSIVSCDSITWIDGVTYTASNNTSTFTLQNAIGCDSIVTLNLTINQGSTGTDVLSACDSLTWIDGITYTSNNNTASYTLINSAGCDSIVTLDLTIGTNVYAGNISGANFIAVGSISLLTSDGDAGGVWTSSDNTVATVDSITGEVTGISQGITSIEYTVTGSGSCSSQVSNYSIAVSLENITINDGGTVYTCSGKFTDSGGLTANYADNQHFIFTLCPNGSDYVKTDFTAFDVEAGFDSLIIYDGANTSGTLIGSFDNSNPLSGIIQASSANATGCLTFEFHSNSTINLAGWEADISCESSLVQISDTICDGSSYNFNGNTLTTAGIYTDTLISSIGQDSVVTLDLTVNNTSFSTDSIVSCDSITWIDGVTYTASNNTSTFTLQNANGCDSVVTLNLTINNSYLSTNSINSCNSYLWNGTSYTQSGIYYDSLQNVTGCDSILILNLTVDSADFTQLNIITCDSYTWNTSTYTTNGNYKDTLQNVNGCDSVISLDLTINNSFSLSTNITACDSYSWNGTTYNVSGIYYDSLQTANGCDSIQTLNLTINSSSNNALNISACNNYSWNGNTYNVSGTYIDTLSSISACDSIVTLNLTINNSYSNLDSVISCTNYLWNGNTYSQSGIYSDTLASISGCDSVVTLALFIYGNYLSIDSVTTCDSYSFNGVQYNVSGLYSDTLTSSTGCDSIISLILTINGAVTSPVILELKLDDFCQETSWNVKNSSNTILYSVPNYDCVFGSGGGPQANDTIIKNMYLAANECYTFELTDYFGDGLGGSGWGGTDGSWLIKGSNNIVIGQGQGNFGYSIEYSFFIYQSIDLILFNSLNNSSNWIIGSPNLQGQWEISSITPPSLTQYVGAMASTSASDGFAYFNGIQYILNGPVGIQDATLELKDTFDLTNFSDVNLDFEQRYKKFNYDETFIEFSTDNGATWPSSLSMQLNSQVITNDPSVQELVSLDISSYVGNQSGVKLRFRWKSDPSSSTNPNVEGSGYGWMIDDLRITVPTILTSVIETQDFKTAVKVYPNPTNENITISINNFTGNIQTKVYDLIGNRLQTTNKTTISLRDYARGIYLLKVAYGDRVEEVKVIKQ